MKVVFRVCPVVILSTVLACATPAEAQLTPAERLELMTNRLARGRVRRGIGGEIRLPRNKAIIKGRTVQLEVETWDVPDGSQVFIVVKELKNGNLWPIPEEELPNGRVPSNQAYRTLLNLGIPYNDPVELSLHSVKSKGCRLLDAWFRKTRRQPLRNIRHAKRLDDVTIRLIKPDGGK